jgi:hypothetical protein
MSDVATVAPASTPGIPNLPQLIMEAPEPVWQQISTTLSVKTREEAIQLVTADPNAAAVVQKIIMASQSKTALTQDQTAESKPTALTSNPKASSAAEVLYGGGGNANLQY